MSRIVKVLSLLFACLLPLASARAAATAPTTPNLLSQSRNAFAADLYAKLRQQPGNLFFSPYSITTAISMVFVGAKGDTAEEIAQTLHLDSLQSKSDGTPLRALLLQNVKQTKLTGEARKDGVQLHVANALWGKTGYPFNSAFVAGIAENFHGNFEPVNFNDEPAARNKINRWVSNQTNEKIQNLISPGALDPTTRLVLTNAIYFKADWAKQFVKSATSQEKFHLSSDHDVSVDMMAQTDSFRLTQQDGFKLLTIPYKNNTMSMLILLPNSIDGLPELEASLTAEKLDGWIEQSEQTKVSLSLPKFKSIGEFNLNGPLSAMGMKKAFAARQADFSDIANMPGDPLYVGAVIHKAFVAVDEEGTEAEAATAVIMKAPTAMRGDQPVPFIADHPFLYIIRANDTGDILFMGRLADPTKQGD